MNRIHSLSSRPIILSWEERPQVAHSQLQPHHWTGQAYSLSSLCKKGGKWYLEVSQMIRAGTGTSHLILFLRRLRAWLLHLKCKSLCLTSSHLCFQITNKSQPLLPMEWVENLMLFMRKFHFLNINKLNQTTRQPPIGNSNFLTLLSPQQNLWTLGWPLRPQLRGASSNRDDQ